VKDHVYFLSGDLGDVIAALPIIRELGGGHLILGPHVGLAGPRDPMSESKASSLATLIAPQEYIASVQFAPKNIGVITHDLSTFRAGEQPIQGETLTMWQARHLKIKSVDMAPWLKVDPSPASSGRAVIARSERYHNPCFDWSVVPRCFPKPAFIGTVREHRRMMEATGEIEHVQTATLLDVAELIAGSDIFIGNQSCPCWIAMGLGHRMIQETCTYVENSVVPRPNAWFVRSEKDFFEACGLESPEQSGLRDCNLRIGTGKCPMGYDDYIEVARWQDLMNLKGRVRIHLHGAWWGKITPQRLQIALSNLEQNESRPVVTVGA
jgi:hypothetical protein